MHADQAATTGPIDLAIAQPFRVGRASVDPATREAIVGEASERLQPQILKVLIALHRNEGRLVTRDELVQSCWDGRIIGEDVINRAISTIRQFAERAGGFAVETIPKAGYRLIEEKAPAPPFRRLVVILGLAVTAFLAASLLYFHQEYSQTSEKQPARPRIELLAFAPDGPDPALAELASQSHDSLATKLAQTQFSVVMAPDQQRDSAPEYRVSGTVRRTGELVLITVRMVERARNLIVYSQEFAGDARQTGKLADQVGASVAGAIGWTVPLLTLEQRHPSDPAITGQLFGELEWNPLALFRGYQTARSVAAKDPNSPLAQLLLGLNAAFVAPQLSPAERRNVVHEGRVAAARAERLAPDFGDTAIPWCLLHSNARITECEARLRAGLKADPDAAFAGWFLADRLRSVGRFTEASDLAAASLAPDPFVGTKLGLAMRLFEATGHGALADQLYRDAARWWPEKSDYFYDRLSGMMDRGDFAAIAAFERAVGPTHWPQGYRSVASLAAAIERRSEPDVRAYCSTVPPGSLHDIMCILALADVGATDAA